ncbi:ABC transporter substrate-binding protein [Plastorhodobacter daqingensis]|uniref:Twin-arginine translocation pathway signal n=2 Tax=Rhodobacterales TaxID=204455 RepID=A0A0B5E111_9RHOB|nr:ABC transporter substrate-binding protein [Celeribacter indicus]AJE46661.1 twin-arginine translocation pathway signal [Celeribacter indicus]SDX56811.1 ABC-type nitrate/sulfonate/bicarbonate transport system, substrate-binding protein [Celeribacter indicus]
MLRPLFFSAALLAAGSPILADTPLRVQLGWIANVQYGEHFIALEDGLFAERGLDVQIAPGGPNAPNALTAVAAGEADIGYTSWLPFLDAVARGNDFVLIAAAMQTSPLGIISLPSHPILQPVDIQGARILAQGPAEKTAIEATLSLAGLPTDDWTMVPGGFSPEPLLAGDGDGYTAFATNQAITLEQMGLVAEEDFYFRSFDDLGLEGYAGLAFVSRQFLEENRETVLAYLEAVVAGWIRSEEDPAYAARLVVDKYGRDYGLELDQQIRQNEVQAQFFRPNGDPDYPIYSLDLEKVAGPMMNAARASGRTELPDPASLIAPELALEALENVKN